MNNKMSSTVLEICDQLEKKKTDLILTLKSDLYIREKQLKIQFNREIKKRILNIKNNFKIEQENISFKHSE